MGLQADKQRDEQEYLPLVSRFEYRACRAATFMICIQNVLISVAQCKIICDWRLPRALSVLWSFAILNSQRLQKLLLRIGSASCIALG